MSEVQPVHDPPSGEEMQWRLGQVRSLMEREGLDWYAVAHTDNVYYLTNFAYIPFERPFFLLLPAAGKPVLVLPLLEVDHARQRVLIDVEYHAYYEYPAPPGRDYASALKEVIGPEERVGIESSLSLALREVIPGKLRVVDLVDEARMVKSDYEVGRIAHASMVVDQGMGKALELSRPGVPVLAIYSEGTREMQARLIMDIPQANFTVSRFLCAVWPGALSAQPHAVPGIFDLLEAGGPHVIIVTGQVDGYSAEVERTFFLGKVPEWAKGPFEVIMEARKLAFDAVKPGVPAAEVDRAVLELIERRGYGDYVLHRTGHGFGITGHEPPWIALGSKDFLQKNMVISVEPGIYIPDKGGFRHSDTVLVTSDGCLSLTRSPDRLEDLVLIL